MLHISSIAKYDKYIHFFEYLFLGFLLLNCIYPRNYKPIILICSISFIILFSGMDEFIIQKYFGKYRRPDYFDWFMDCIGSSGGIIIRFILKDKIK